MKFLWGSKDGGPESRVRMWGFESKRFGSLLLLRFEEGTRESFHTHAFNAWSWVLRGALVEQTLQEKGATWSPDKATWAGFGPSFRPIYTDRRRFHRVAGGRQGAWVITLRGRWWDGWREYNPVTGEQTKLTNGRQLRDVLPSDKPDLSATGSFPAMSIMCAVCRKRPSTAVLSVPGMAISEAYCDDCARGDAIPWDLAVMQTACLGGRFKTSDQWQRICEATVFLNKKTLVEFDRQVAKCADDMDQLMAGEQDREALKPTETW